MLRIFFVILLFLSTDAISLDDQMRAKRIYSQIRCPTCQGQSLEDTNTQHAKMLREYVDEQISLHKTDDEILDSIREGYGEFIVLKPKFSAHTLFLWVIPLLVFAGSSIVIFKRIRM